jgi:hypothetical protein
MAHDKLVWPSWAQYLAQDPDGSWWFYEFKPEIAQGGWDSEEGHFTEVIGPVDWYNSLTARPKE